jgi:hypothetical protein
MLFHGLAFYAGIMMGVGMDSLMRLSSSSSNHMSIYLTYFVTGCVLMQISDRFFYRRTVRHVDIEVDRVNKQITVDNKCKLLPHEFDFFSEPIIETKFSGGGFTGGQSVYVPPSSTGAVAYNAGQGTSTFVNAQSTGQLVWVEGKEYVPGRSSSSTVG